MKDHRSVDNLSIEELERILLVKRREARLLRLRRMDRSEHIVGRDPLEPAPPAPTPPPISTAYRQFQDVGALAGYRAVEVDDGRWRFLYSRVLCWLLAPLRIVRSRLAGINWRFIFNAVFLLIETVAVAGLVVIVIGTWQDRERISTEADEIFVPPTPTATPRVKTVNAVVLPGGHTPPDARGFSQPEPVPERLRALAETITPWPVPTRGPEHAVRIAIPSIGVDHLVVEGDDWETLKRGVGHILWSANPGQVGNCVLVAHNDIFGEIFGQLSEVELDDEIFIYTAQIHRYVVKATHIVEPTQVDVMDPTTHPTLTLISSYPYLVDDKRIVVIAELASQ